MKYSNKVKAFTLLSDYRVRVTFNDGYDGEVDLWPLFEHPRGPMTEPFRSPSFFQKAFLDHGILSWPNSYDICADVLRYYCEQGRVTSKEEMNAYFNPEPTFVLNDKPSK
ncbi:MAG: DUF2442 domain-containing protein [Verrucomicrobiota bacterium]